MELDRDSFRELLLKAIGPRTQKSFAAMCGMTPQYLNRLMHSDSIVPTLDTLTRIASHAYGGVTLYALCRACDIDPAAVSQEPHVAPWQLGSVRKRAEAVNQALTALDKNWFHRNPGPNAMVFDSVDQLTYPVASHGGSHARDSGWKMLVFHTEVFRVVLTDKPLWDRYLLRSQPSKPLTSQLRADRYFTGFNSFSVSRTGR